MMKQLIWAAALLFATVGSASATEISFDGYCDGLSLKVSSIYVTAPFTGCEKQYFTEGLKVKIDGISYVALSANSFGAGYAVTYLVQYPFVTGGVFYVFDTADGKTQTESYSGTYTIGRPTASSANLPSTQHMK
jgi:hypothetical protein